MKLYLKQRQIAFLLKDVVAIEILADQVHTKFGQNSKFFDVYRCLRSLMKREKEEEDIW